MSTVTISGDTFEAGASILHPKNFHTLNYSKLLNLEINGKNSDSTSESLSLGIWDGKKFVFKTLKVNFNVPFLDKLVSLVNSLRIFIRYGMSLLKMNSFVEVLASSFDLSCYECSDYLFIHLFVVGLFRVLWIGL